MNGRIRGEQVRQQRSCPSALLRMLEYIAEVEVLASIGGRNQQVAVGSGMSVRKEGCAKATIRSRCEDL